ncbi:AAA family ATPase [Sulfurimonas autotrophica]|uniref:Plasmid partitioning protein n=1 Tax=Sulfurimonas autotrophica (strain ATCC BAA-671 / DSM 16294 / JCM 11897 / OK10) TaxID=563040 RepID=E0UTA5_SULAO|nr:AAA family ATPase [Sulfurimonas autotrophica]ADN08208.1 plasmid partitioning protein [Sulfurimonas autotrophica DSM 16294]
MIVLFGHQKGGVGKSTVSINVAYQLQKKYKDLVLLDLDSQNSAILFNQLRISENLPTIKCVKESDIDFSNFINEYSGNKENLLIIDSGGYDSDVNRAALIKADIIITPVGISQIEIFGLQKFRKILKEASEALDVKIKTNVLLNNVDSRSKNKLRDLREYIKENNKYFNLLDSVIHTRADYKNSYGDGLTVKELNKKGTAAQEIKQLTKEILKLVNN